MMNRLIWLVFWMLAFGACHPTQEIEPGVLPGLWRYHGGIIEQEATDAFPLAYLRFSTDSSWSGYTSRNSVTGVYYLQDQLLTLQLKTSTYVADGPFSSTFSESLRASYDMNIKRDRMELVGNRQLIFYKILETDCIEPVQSSRIYNESMTDPFTIHEVHLIDRCLETWIGYSGGCNDVTVQLVASEDYEMQDAPLLPVKLVMNDHDDCEAYLIEPFYFDLSSLKYFDSNQLLLSIQDWEEKIYVQFD